MTSDPAIESWVNFVTDTLTFPSWLLPRVQRNSECCSYIVLIYIDRCSVQDDVIASLHMNRNRMAKILHPFNRENLFYEIRYTANLPPEERMADVQQFISSLHQRRGRPSSGIVYCRTRQTCDEVSNYLRCRGLSARPYHKGLK